jgi:AcrR family transcriptional regulator
MTPMPTTSGHRYGGVPADERARLRRERLVDAALDLIGAGAWRSATVDALCAGAGLNKRYFYESFPDLDAVARAAVDEVAGQVVTAALTAFLSHQDEVALEVRASTTLGAVVRVLVEDPRKAHTLFGPLAGSHDTLEHRAMAVSGLTAVLVEQARTIHDVALEADSLAAVTPAFLVGGTGEAILAWLRDPGHSSLERLVEDLTTLWLLTGNGAAAAAAARLGAPGPPSGN